MKTITSANVSIDYAEFLTKNSRRENKMDVRCPLLIQSIFGRLEEKLICLGIDP